MYNVNVPIGHLCFIFCPMTITEKYIEIIKPSLSPCQKNDTEQCSYKISKALFKSAIKKAKPVIDNLLSLLTNNNLSGDFSSFQKEAVRTRRREEQEALAFKQIRNRRSRENRSFRSPRRGQWSPRIKQTNYGYDFVTRKRS